jgi:hypothetical protein
LKALYYLLLNIYVWKYLYAFQPKICNRSTMLYIIMNSRDFWLWFFHGILLFYYTYIYAEKFTDVFHTMFTGVHSHCFYFVHDQRPFIILSLTVSSCHVSPESMTYSWGKLLSNLVHIWSDIHIMFFATEQNTSVTRIYLFYLFLLYFL